MCRLLGEHASAEEEMQQHIKDLEAELLQRDQNIDTMKKELESEKENNSRAPTTTMKNMVERLKNQLSLKEKQLQVNSVAKKECLLTYFWSNRGNLLFSITVFVNGCNKGT